MKIRFSGQLLLLLICLGSFSLRAQKQHHKTVKSVTELNSLSPDTCLITAFVTSIYKCPPCPPGAICKPCIGDHVTISDVPNTTDKSIRVLTKDFEKYSVGKKYTFLIKLHKTKDKQIFEAVLIGEKNK
jgi:hypothetical protein